MTRLACSLCSVWAVIGLWGCGEAPVRIAPGDTAARLPARFAGIVHLAGELAGVESGSLFLIVRPPGSRLPSLARKYEIGDPAFSIADGDRYLHFALDERDGMGSADVPMFDEMEIEARYDPDGIVDTDEGVVRAFVLARPGAGAISIVVSPSPGSAVAPPIAGSGTGS